MLTIREGFKHLTDQIGWYKKCRNNGKKLNPNTARVFKMKFRQGTLSDPKMIELLESTGEFKIYKAQCELIKK